MVLWSWRREKWVGVRGGWWSKGERALERVVVRVRGRREERGKIRVNCRHGSRGVLESMER